jgi:hypothetical protein
MRLRVHGDEATNLITLAGGEPAHDLVPGQPVTFTRLSGGSGITAGTTYYVIASGLTPRTFKVSATAGGSAAALTTEMTAGFVTYTELSNVSGSRDSGTTGLFSTTLAASISFDDTSLTVADPTPVAAQGSGFRICIDDELLLVTAGQPGTTWTVTRGIEGTTAAAHAGGATVAWVLTAASLPAVGTLGYSNGVDDTAAIQAALDAARLTYAPATVRGLPGQTYLITTLVVGAYTTLDMTGCTVRQITGTDTNMLRNWSFAGASTIQDAAITAGDKTLTSASSSFGAGHVGQNVRIWGAGGGGEVYVDTIASINSGTSVELYGAASTTVTAGQATIKQWDRGITVRGGLWDRGNNGRLFAYAPGHPGDEAYRVQDASGFGMLFRRVAFLTVRDVEFAGGNANACTALCVGDATDFVIDNIGTDYFMSGLVQVTGPARRGTVTNVHGRCTDDLMAVLALDWLTGVRDVWGDVAYITMDGIHSNWCDGMLVDICPGSASLGISTKHIYIRNVYGMATNLTQHDVIGGLISLADTAAFPDMAGGLLDDVVIENVSGSSTGDYDQSRGLIYIAAPNIGRMRFSGINTDAPTGMVQHGIVLGPDTDIGYLSISDSVISSVDGNCSLVDYSIGAGSVIHNVGLARNAYRVNGVWSIITDVNNPTYAETLLAMTPLVYWRLGESAGPTAVDASGNAYHGTYTSGTHGATGLLAGDAGTAWTGNGSTSKIEGPTIPACAAWTICFWAKSNGVNGDYAGYFSTPSDQIDIAVQATTPTTFRYFEGAWLAPALSQVATTATFVALTYDGTDTQFYINGATTDLFSGAGRGLSNAGFTVATLGAAHVNDTLQEFAIFNRAITGPEIASLYAKGAA